MRDRHFNTRQRKYNMIISMDFEQARFNMVEQQVRPWDVLDPHVLDVISAVPREAFVPENQKNLAYADTRILLGSYEGHPCRMLNPNIEGRLLQALEIEADNIVLEIGSGSGYLTACLARLARHVDSVDIDPAMTAMAEKNLAAQNVANATLSTGNAANGWSEQKPYYDVIAITASMSTVPMAYKSMLKTSGRLFVICGEAPVMKAMLITRIDKEEWREDELFETSVDPLIDAEPKQQFVF
jgi:protein-L-isoaspartate(D-aspartate) O-methyltransferase